MGFKLLFHPNKNIFLTSVHS